MRRRKAAPSEQPAPDAVSPSGSGSGSTSSSAAALASGLKYLVASQVATRAITFSLNLLTTRLLSVDAYGVAAVQFHLINTTILLLAREGIRRGCITGQQQQHEKKKKKDDDDDDDEEKDGKPAALKLAATAALSFPVGCLVATFLVAPFFLRGLSAEDPHYRSRRTAVHVQVAAALVELAAEPFYVVAAVRGALAPRVAGEAGGTLVRGVLSLALLRFCSGTVDPGVALSLAQLGYALTWLLAHFAAFSGEVASEVQKWKRSRSRPSSKPKRRSSPRKTKTASTSSSPPSDSDSSLFLGRRALSLCGGFTLQAAEKLALAEGSRAVLAVAASPASQGEFGLAANVGSLAVRTLFQPIEEAAFLAFARKGGEEDGKKKEKKKSSGGGGANASENANANEIGRANALLALLCRCVTLVGATGAAFGPPFAFALVRLAYGHTWACDTAASRALGAYAAYTALLALNGVLEAFVHARGGPAELARGNAALLALAAFGAGAGAFGARRFGSVGLVAADAVTMVARIAWSLGAVGRLSRGDRGGEKGDEIERRTKSRTKSSSSSSSSPPPRLRDLLPSAQTLAALALASCLGFASDAFFFGARASGQSSSSSSSSSPLFRCSLQGRELLTATVAHGLVGVVALAGVALVALKNEKDTIEGVRLLRSGKAVAAVATAQ